MEMVPTQREGEAMAFEPRKDGEKVQGIVNVWNFGRTTESADVGTERPARQQKQSGGWRTRLSVSGDGLWTSAVPAEAGHGR